MFFSSQKFDNVNIDKYNVFGVVETWTNSEANISLPGFTAMHDPDVKQKGYKGRHQGRIQWGAKIGKKYDFLA